jgi:hypothetical protein
MKTSALGKLIRLVEKHLFPKAHRTAAMNCESETAKDPAQESAAPFFTPDPYDATKCDMCGQHKESVRSRTVITIGLNSGTVRWKFCDECAATVSEWSQPKDQEDKLTAGKARRRLQRSGMNKKPFQLMPPRQWRSPWIREMGKLVDKCLHPERHPQYFQRHNN